MIVLTAFLTSCEDVIPVNLQDTAPRIVIEGNISNLVDSVSIYLHKSTDFFKPSGIVPVTGATVHISDPQGKSYLLTDDGDGKYTAGDFQAEYDELYSLDVTAEGKQYKAASRMPEPVKIDSLIFRKEPGDPRDNQIVLYIKDPAGIDNYYQVKLTRNDSLPENDNQFVLYSDKYFDGRSTNLAINIRRFGISHFERNDTVKVWLISLEKMIYDYYRVLHDITDKDNTLSGSTPSNPPNNLSNGALGYFTASSASEITVVVK